MGAAAQFNVTVRGKGGHAAMPHTTVDPVVAGAAVVTALQVCELHCNGLHSSYSLPCHCCIGRHATCAASLASSSMPHACLLKPGFAHVYS